MVNGRLAYSVVRNELIICFRGVRDLRLLLATSNYAAPDDGGENVECVNGPEL